MSVFAIIVAGMIAVIALILALPCTACRRRRERWQAAYAQWRATQLKK
jgi:hypothetical protein